MQWVHWSTSTKGKRYVQNLFTCSRKEHTIYLGLICKLHLIPFTIYSAQIKFELMDVMPVNSMPESCSFYTHVNFTARSSKEGSQEQLFFAELQLCSRRQASSGFIVTCCEPLGPDNTGEFFSSVVRSSVPYTKISATSKCAVTPTQK
jgi:hypothetical protein